MNKNRVYELLNAAKPGERLNIISIVKDEISKIAIEKGFKIIKGYEDDPELLVIEKRKDKKEKSTYQKIIEILQNYKAGYITVDFADAKYVRTVVSQYNNRTSEKFKVTITDGEAQIYLELEDRKHITEAEFRILSAQYDGKLAELKAKIKPGEFFGTNTLDGEEELI